MRVGAGKYDRRIVIQQTVEAVSAAGVAKSTWSTLATVPAEKMPLTATERFGSNATREAVACKYRIRWRAGLNSDMQLVDGSETFRITGINEVGRRDELILFCELVR